MKLFKAKRHIKKLKNDFLLLQSSEGNKGCVINNLIIFTVY